MRARRRGRLRCWIAGLVGRREEWEAKVWENGAWREEERERARRGSFFLFCSRIARAKPGGARRTSRQVEARRGSFFAVFERRTTKRKHQNPSRTTLKFLITPSSSQKDQKPLHATAFVHPRKLPLLLGPGFPFALPYQSSSSSLSSSSLSPMFLFLLASAFANDAAKSPPPPAALAGSSTAAAAGAAVVSTCFEKNTHEEVSE